LLWRLQVYANTSSAETSSIPSRYVKSTHTHRQLRRVRFPAGMSTSDSALHTIITWCACHCRLEPRACYVLPPACFAAARTNGDATQFHVRSSGRGDVLEAEACTIDARAWNVKHYTTPFCNWLRARRDRGTTKSLNRGCSSPRYAHTCESYSAEPYVHVRCRAIVPVPGWLLTPPQARKVGVASVPACVSQIGYLDVIITLTE
jgi:hypothetical protein